MANAGTGGCGLGAHHGVDVGTGSRRSRSRSRGAVRGLGTGFVSELPEFFGVEEVQCGALGDEVRGEGPWWTRPEARVGVPDIYILVRRPVVRIGCPYLSWFHSHEAMGRFWAERSRTTSATATTAATASASSSSVENCGFSFIGDIRHSATVSEKTEDNASDWLFLLDLGS